MGKILRKYKIYFYKIYFLKAILIVKPYRTSILRETREIKEVLDKCFLVVV